MCKNKSLPPKAFSVMEFMVAILVLSILIKIAYSAYTISIVKSKTAGMLVSTVKLQQAFNDFYQYNGNYNKLVMALGSDFSNQVDGYMLLAAENPMVENTNNNIESIKIAAELDKAIIVICGNAQSLRHKIVLYLISQNQDSVISWSCYYDGESKSMVPAECRKNINILNKITPSC